MGARYFTCVVLHKVFLIYRTVRPNQLDLVWKCTEIPNRITRFHPLHTGTAGSKKYTESQLWAIELTLIFGWPKAHITFFR